MVPLALIVIALLPINAPPLLPSSRTLPAVLLRVALFPLDVSELETVRFPLLEMLRLPATIACVVLIEPALLLIVRFCPPAKLFSCKLLDPELLKIMLAPEAPVAAIADTALLAVRIADWPVPLERFIVNKAVVMVPAFWLILPELDDRLKEVAALIVPDRTRAPELASCTVPVELIPAAPPKLAAPDPLMTAKLEPAPETIPLMVLAFKATIELFPFREITPVPELALREPSILLVVFIAPALPEFMLILPAVAVRAEPAPKLSERSLPAPPFPCTFRSPLLAVKEPLLTKLPVVMLRVAPDELVP